MPIHPLPLITDEDELKAIEKLKPPKTIVVRYGYTKQVGEFPYDGDQVIGCGTKLVIRTERGVEIGDMLTTTCSNSGCGKSISREQMLRYIENSGGKQYPFSTQGRVLRVATVEDLNEWSRIEATKMPFLKQAREIVRTLDLPMKMVEVEQLLSRDRIIFYFISESRIDFRELVRQLAKDMHARIEMRQVGARDEARIVADYEKCGQHCCCKQFLKVLKPVSMKAAKIQKATLDPSKISGRCGRLMCCLRYEEATYDELRANLPPRGAYVQTADGPGWVVMTQILTQLAMVELASNGERAAYAIETLERLPDGPPRPRPDQQGSPQGDERPQRGGPRPDRNGPPRPGAGPRPPMQRPEGPPQEGPPVQDTAQQQEGSPADAPRPESPPRQQNNPARPPMPPRQHNPRQDGPPRQDRGAPQQDRNAPRQDRPATGPRPNPQQRPPQPPRQEPRRPMPGQPLNDNEVESREGENSAALPDDVLNKPADLPGEINAPGSPDADGPDAFDAPDPGDGPDDGPQGTGDPNNPNDPNQPQRSRRRRRRRGRGRGGQGGQDRGPAGPIDSGPDNRPPRGPGGPPRGPGGPPNNNPGQGPSAGPSSPPPPPSGGSSDGTA
jgi:cell fate regulator YaaT (PSP1 superfamily)